MSRFWLLAAYVTIVGAAGSCSSPTQSQSADAPIRVRWARDPESLDPFMQPNQNATDAVALLTGGLLTVDMHTKQVEPLLAEALPTVSYSGDSLTLLAYRLRPVARWDSGAPITAADVAFTLKLVHCKELPTVAIVEQTNFIQDIRLDARNPRSFTLVCTGKAPSFVQASGDFPVVREAALDPDHRLRAFSLPELRGRIRGSRAAALAKVQQQLVARYNALDPGQHPESIAGTGAYQLVKWDRDRKLVFARKKQWWGDSVANSLVFQAKPSRLEYVIIPDEATATLALTNGQCDIFPGMPVRAFERLKKSASASRLAFYTSATYEVMTAGFNTSKPALHDAKTRQALARLFNAAELCQASQQGQGVRTVGLISPQEKALYNDSLRLLEYSPGEAATMLTAAGWQRSAIGWSRKGNDGAPQNLRLQLRYRAGETNYELVALQFAAAAKSIGIAVDLSPTESGVLYGMLDEGNYDMYVQSIKGNPFLFNFLPLFGRVAIGTGNVTRFGTADTDQLLTELANAPSVNERARLLRKFQAMMREQMPIVPLYFVANRVAADKHIAGLGIVTVRPGYVVTSSYRTQPPQ